MIAFVAFALRILFDRSGGFVGWIAAFKVVPWSDVLAAAPVVAQGARKLWTSVRKTPVQLEGDEPLGLDGRLDALERQIAELKRENAAFSDLIKSLAEQNAQLVEVVRTLKTRTQILLLSFAASFGALGVALWLLYR
jgi:hypothetical protein